MKFNFTRKVLFLFIMTIIVMTSFAYAKNSGDANEDNGRKKFQIYTILGKGGKIFPEDPEVIEGRDQRFEIVPYENYKVKDVIVDGTSIGSPYVHTIRDIHEDHVIEVIFLKQTNKAKEEEKAWDNPFEDVKEDDWFYDAIRYAHKHEIFNGITETTFEPNSKVTRGMLVEVLFRLSNAVNYVKSDFADVSEDAYYSCAVAWATKSGIINGVGNYCFAPDEPITRQDLATIIYRYAKFKGRGYAQNMAYLLDYNDKDMISEYAYEPICWCTTTEVLKGKDDKKIDPLGFATRAETATMIQRLVDVMK